MGRGKLGIIACSSGRYFAEKMLEKLGPICKEGECRIISTKESTFANGETKTVINEHIRGDDIYIVQCVDDPLSEKSINDLIMELITAVDAARRSDANYVTAVVFPFPYARQEKQASREAITASVLARTLEDTGADGVMTLDVHADAIAGFFRKAIFFNLYATHAIIRYFTKEFNIDPQDLVVVSPDAGGAKRARFYAKTIGSKLAIFNKERDYSKVNVVNKVTLIGDIKGKKHALVVDDMIDTGGTMCRVAEMLKDEGIENIYVACSYAFLHGKAVEKFSDLYKRGIIKAMIGTDVIYRGKEFEKEHPWYKAVSMAGFFANIIKKVNEEKSTLEVLDEEYKR